MPRDLVQQNARTWVAPVGRKSQKLLVERVGNRIQSFFGGLASGIPATMIGSAPASVRAIEDIGNALYEEGKLDEAMTYYERELRIAREVGDKSGISSALGNIANALDGPGDLVGAQKIQEQALQLR